MRFLSNAHTHSAYCDGRNTLPEMMRAAQARGFQSLGFSEHAWQGFDERYAMTKEGQTAYLREIRALQQARKPGEPRLWAGLELDGMAREACRGAVAGFDYVIGSTHYATLDFHGEPVAVDGDADRLRLYVDEAFHGDGLAMTRWYYELETGALLRDRPAIIGHFDLVRKHAARARLFDEADPAYQRIALHALERAFSSGAILEVNTGGMARGYLPTPYPTRTLLCAWREMGGRVTVTSDCHDARYLDFAFEQALALIRGAGFQSVEMLGTHDALWETVEL